MDGNKDLALRCISLAKEQISLGNKERAFEIIKIAQMLNHSWVDHELLAACEKLDSGSQSSKQSFVTARNVVDREKVEVKGVSKGEKNYTTEGVTLIREINSKKDYYSILGVEKGCLVEEIRKAYLNLSLKVHPDKNKAPGSEDAFKKVDEAFKCLRDESSRREYDQRQNVRRRRRTGHVLMVLGQLVLVLVIILLAYIPTSEPEYSLQKNYIHQFMKVTEEYGVGFFVKSSKFDEIYPIGTPARHKIENSVIKDIKSFLGRYCDVELQQRQRRRDLPTPNCDKLRHFGVAWR